MTRARPVQSETEPGRRAGAALGLLALMTGVGISLMAWVNATMSVRVHSPVQAAFTSYLVQLVVMLTLMIASPLSRGGWPRLWIAIRTGTLHPAFLLTGFGGLIYVLGQAYAVPLLGVALFTIAVVAGQAAGSLIADSAGLGVAGRHGLTPRRFLAAGLVLVAVIVVVLPGVGSGGFALLSMVVGCVVGLVGSLHVPASGRVALSAGSALAASAFGSAVATLLLGAALVVRTVGGEPVVGELQAWWLYLSGCMGCVVYLLSIAVIVRMGVLLFTCLQVAGLLACAVALDAVLPISRFHATPVSMVGAGLLALAVILIVAETPARLV